jgi:predicted dehydrogenase
MDKKTKFTVVGCGHIGKRHAEMVSRNPQAELVALVDTRGKEILKLDQYQVPFFYSLKEFLNSE